MQDFTSTLDTLRQKVDEAAEANMAAATAEAAERDKAIQAANDAGLSVDAGALPSIGASDAQVRFLTLQALLADAQAQYDQIKSLLG